MVDLSKSEEQLIKELYSWASFLEIQSSSIPSHVIILGSRKDKFSGKPDLLQSKCDFVEHCAKDALKDQHLAGFVALDSRQLSYENILPFLKLLAKSIKNLIVPGIHKKMSYGCHLLHDFLKQKIKEKAISLERLQTLVSRDRVLHHVADAMKLASMLQTIADKGLLLFLRNPKNLSSSCVVIDKVRLLHEVNGTLFAPSFFKEHHQIASNTGIVQLSRLHTIFLHYDPKILVAFLTSLHFCRPVDPAILANITTNLSPEAATNEEILYFPALVSVERKSDLSIPKGFGWCVYCTNPRRCLTQRYSDSLFLDLAYSICTSIPPPPKLEHPDQAIVRKLNRGCMVWRNGIHWWTDDDIQVMVQVTEENQCVSLSMSIEKECSPKWLKLRSSLMDTILSKKEKLCPNVTFTEYFVSPSQLGLVSRKNLSQLTVFEMNNVIRCASLQSKFVPDINGRERISPSSLLLADPYLVLRPALVQQLFDKDRGNHPVSSTTLKEVRHHIEYIPITDNETYQSLREQLNRWSLFAGRNPIVLVGLKADELPYVPPMDSEEDPPPASSAPPTGATSKVHSAAQDGAKATETNPSSHRSKWSLDGLPDGELDDSHLADLVDCLHNLHDWIKLGVFLGIPYPNLEKIELDKQGVDNRKIAMFHKWLSSGSANKEILLAALTKMGSCSQ